MIKVYFSKIGSEWDASTLNEQLSLFPIAMKEKIMRYKEWRARQSRILGKQMLLRLIRDFEQDLALSDLQYSPLNKPFFEGSFNFSIAHSGDMVICTASVDSQIGIDIEHKASLDIADYKEQLTKNEWDYIQNASDRLNTFYEIWTRKEAWLKATGRGVDIDLNEIDVCGDTAKSGDIEYSFLPINIELNYTANIATSEAYIEIEVSEF